MAAANLARVRTGRCGYGLPSMTPLDWIGRSVADNEGVPYGTLEELFVGRSSGEPEFAFVAVDGKRVAVPLTNAHAHGDVVVLPLDPERVRSAPAIQREVTSIPPEAGELVLEYFGLKAPPTTPIMPVAPAVPAVPAAPTPPAGDQDQVEVTLSEEELVVDKQQAVVERVRLRKVIVEEDVTVTVTLRREELRVEREAVPADTPVARGDGDAQLSDGELVFVLLAEEPVVRKRVVPTERIRVARDTVVEHERIDAQVRKERAEVDSTPTTSQERTT